MSISKKRLAEIEAIQDEDIDTSDIPEADASFFKAAKPPKKPVTIRLDVDLLASLKGTGKGWQTRVNDLLRRELM